MGVGIDQAGHQDTLVTIHYFGCIPFRSDFLLWPNGNDFCVFDGYGARFILIELLIHR